MLHVIIVGGGLAGTAAASEASNLGADVTVLERSRYLLPPKSAWPSLFTGELKPVVSEGSGFEKLGERIEEVDVAKRTVKTNRGRVAYDSIVIATGSTYRMPSFRGAGKKNSFVMREYSDYKEVAEHLHEFARVVVAGGGPLPLTVAEKASQLGVKVLLLAPNGILSGYLTEAMSREIELRSVKAGVQIVRSPLGGVAGVEKLEAVLAGDSVYPSDALVFFPVPVPNPPRLAVELGRSGGILVDDRMRASAGGVHAAGDCTEIKLGSSSTTMMFQSAAKTMGQVAGANAAGSRAVARLSSTVSHTFFAYEVCYGGLTLESARSIGMNVLEAETEPRADHLICNIVYDQSTLLVRGMQISGPRASYFGEVISLIIAEEMRLDDLVYLESNLSSRSPTDVSPIEMAARTGLGLRRKA